MSQNDAFTEPRLDSSAREPEANSLLVQGALLQQQQPQQQQQQQRPAPDTGSMSSGNRSVLPGSLPMGGWAGFPMDSGVSRASSGSSSGGVGRSIIGVPPQYAFPPPSLDRAFDITGSSATGAPLSGDLKRKVPMSGLSSSPEEKNSKALAPRRDISEPQQQHHAARSSSPVPLAPSTGQHPRASPQQQANDSSGVSGTSGNAPKRRRGQAKGGDNGSAKNNTHSSNSNTASSTAVALAHLLLRPGGTLHPVGAPLLQPPGAASPAVTGSVLAAWLQRYWAAERVADAAAAAHAPYGWHFDAPTAALLENPLLLANSNPGHSNTINGGGKGVNVDALAAASSPDASLNDMRRGLLRGRRWLPELLLALLPSHEAAFLQLRACVKTLLENPQALTCPEAERVVAMVAANPHDSVAGFAPYLFPRGTARASSSSSASAPALMPPDPPSSGLARSTSSSSPALPHGGAGAAASHSSSVLVDLAAAMPMKNTATAAAATKVAPVNLPAESLQSSSLKEALKQVGSQRAALSSLVLDHGGAEGVKLEARSSNSSEATVVGRSRRVDDSVASAAVAAMLARARLALASSLADASARLSAAAQTSAATNDEHSGNDSDDVYVCTAVVNPFGASGFEADTCDAWALEPSSSSSSEHSNKGAAPLQFQPPPPLLSSPPSDGTSPIPEAAVAQLRDLCLGNKNNNSGGGSSGQGSLLLDSSPSGGCNLVASALNAGAGYGPVLIVAPFARLQAWQDALSACAPRLKVLPYWGGARDRATLRTFLTSSATGHEHAAWHVCLAPPDAACGDVAPTTLARGLVWSLCVIDDALPLVADARARSARATLLRATSGPNCAHGRLLVCRDLAISASALPPPGAGRRAVEALAGLVCGLYPDHHAVVRRAVGRALAKATVAAAMQQQQQASYANSSDSHESRAVMELEGRVVPALVKLAAPLTMVYPGSSNSQSEASNNPAGPGGRDGPSSAAAVGSEESLKGWRRVAAAALALPGGEEEKQGTPSQSMVDSRAPLSGDQARKSASLLRQDATAVATKTICAALFGSSGQASINNSSDPPTNAALEFAKLDRGLNVLRDKPLLAQHAYDDAQPSTGSLVIGIEAASGSSSDTVITTPSPSAQSPTEVYGFDDDFQRFTLPPPPHKAAPDSAVVPGGIAEDMANNHYQPEFLSLWSAPAEAEEDAEDGLAGDVYPYGDYLYGSAEGAARGVGVGGAGGVVLDLSGVPEHLPPMPRQRSTGPATSSRFRGVCRSKRTATDKWQAQISYGGTNYYLGLFDSEEEAGVAYARAHYKFYGPGREGGPGASSFAVAAAATSSSTTAAASGEATPAASAVAVAPGAPSSAKGASGLALNLLSGNASHVAATSGEGSSYYGHRDGALGGEINSAHWAGMGPPLLCSDTLAAQLLEYSDNVAPEEAMQSLSSLWASDELELGCWSPAEGAADAARTRAVRSKTISSAHPSSGGVYSSSSSAAGAVATPMDALQGGNATDASSSSGSGKQGEKKARAPRGSKQGNNKGSGSSSGSATSSEDTVSLLPLKVVTSKQSSSAISESVDSSSNTNLSEAAWPYGGSLELENVFKTSEQVGSASSGTEAPAAAAVQSALQALRSLVGEQLRCELQHAASANGIASEASASSFTSPGGYFKLVGRGSASPSAMPQNALNPVAGAGAASRSEAAAPGWAFSATAQRPTMVLGSAGGVWAKALEVCTGRASLAVPPGLSCGDVDCHLGEGLVPGPHAIVKWQPGVRKDGSQAPQGTGTSSGDSGAYVVTAVGAGCTLNEVALGPGQPALLSSGSVLGFGAAAKTKELATGRGGTSSVLVQVLLPLHAESCQGTSSDSKTTARPIDAADGATRGRATEAVVLAALRFATADSDLAPYLPTLPDTA